MKDRDKTKEQLIKELEALRLRVGELDKLVKERKQMEHDLNERLKEINCLYGVADIAARPGITLDELYQDVVKLLPPSWLYPEITCVRITINGKKFETKNYGDTEWRQSADIKVDGAKVGVVEVLYLEEKPEIDEGPFLREEGLLIDAVAERLGYITERKQAEEALVRSNAELEQFAYIASHDLQEPLRMVTSYTQLLEKRYKDRLDADAHDFIGYAVDGATRMQRMINDLLTYSRVGTQGKDSLPTHCEDVLSQVAVNLKLAIEESGALVTHDPLPTVMADESQLVQLFQNLISNAIRYRNRESPRIHVSAEQKGDEWFFSVSDNGIGIESQYFDRIFQVFQRLHSGSHRGSGIGLAVCRKIIERHGGRIWVESEIGKGSTFYFTIPLKEGRQS
ncbi:ATP-binding protein [Chloroflexota bacterium]